MKQITKCHALQKVENFGGVFVSVCVMSLAALRVRFPVCLGGTVVSLV
jgi:hypothetical protein